MRQKMIQAPPAAKKTAKPQTEFGAFDALATKLLKVPKTAIRSAKKHQKGSQPRSISGY